MGLQKFNSKVHPCAAMNSFMCTYYTTILVMYLQTAVTIPIIRYNSPNPACWDLLPYVVTIEQSHNGHSHKPYEEQSAGTVKDARM